MGKKEVKSVVALLSPIGYWMRKKPKGSSPVLMLQNVNPEPHLSIVRLNQPKLLVWKLPLLSVLKNKLEAPVSDVRRPNGCGGPIRHNRVRRDGVLGNGRRRGGGHAGAGSGRINGGCAGVGGGGGGGGGRRRVSCNLCRLGCRYRYCPCKREGRRCGAQCRCIENSYLNHCFNRA